MTGSVTTIRADKLEERYSPSLLSNLEGRVAGLTTYGGKTTIRGTSSLYAETDPLLVVDGIPIEGSIDDLNPYDIESVNVLKDARLRPSTVHVRPTESLWSRRRALARKGR